MTRGNSKCWNPLSGLVVFLVLVIVVLITTVILLRTAHHQDTVVGKPEALVAQRRVTVGSTIPSVPGVCVSQECITLAHQLHNFHDPAIDPCIDFYKSACGKYSEHTVVDGVRADKKEKIINRLLKDFLSRMGETTSRSEKAMKILYDKCQGRGENTTKTIESNFQDIFKDAQKIGAWPLADPKWTKSKFKLNDFLSNIAKLGRINNGLFRMKTFEQPYLTVIPIGSDKPPKNLDTILTWFLEKNGVKIDQKTMKNDVKEYRKLSHDLRKMAKGSDLDFVDLSVIEAQNPSIDFRRVANSFINPGRKILENKIKERIEAIENPAFIDEKHRLEKIISKAGPRAVANYLIIFYVDQTIGRLQDLAEETCIELILNYLPNPALRVFIRNYFKKENLEIVSGMIEENREIFKEMLRESTWLHEETKKNAILKLEKMGKMIGYPEEFEAEGALDKTYETLNLLEDESLYTTIRKLNKFNMEQTMEYVALESPLDPDPEASLIQVNAFYSQLSNSLTILAPFIDDPLFDATFPKYAKIAGIGNTVAHQIGHGYDPEGRLADETGEEKDWWTPEDTVEYEKRTQCMIDQYDNYDDPEYGKNLNGSVTINEMVADNIGVEVSWNAFKKLDLSKEPRIVGFGNYSIPKLYFRISALEFCRARDDSPDLVKELTRHHPTDSFRVNGVFSNMKQFADTFNCPVGSPMNPETKCVLF